MRAPQETALDQSVLEEVRIALLDVRQACSTQNIDLQNLEEKVAEIKPSSQAIISNLQARIAQLEKQILSIQADLHQLSSHANQTTESLLQYRNQIHALDTLLKHQNGRLDEIANLKTTLNSISQAISNPTIQTVSKNVKIYRVVPGDSLEKIAREHNTSVDLLKKTNHLTTSTIMIGQELKIPE